MKNTHAPLLIGCAAGFSGDRVDAPGPVVDTLIELGGPSALFFETLGERTVALDYWNHHYNWHPPHQGIGGSTPMSRLKLSGNNLLTLHS